MFPAERLSQVFAAFIAYLPEHEGATQLLAEWEIWGWKRVPQQACRPFAIKFQHFAVQRQNRNTKGS
jgi:hypothetical protein